MTYFTVNYTSFPLFTGIFSDFDPIWYKNIGITILFSMIIYSFSAHAGYITSPLIKKILRCCDSGCSAEGKTTKKRTRKEYINLYSGPNFDIGARYSEVIFKLI